MQGAYDSPMAFILTVDRGIFYWVLTITFFFALSIVAVLSKERRWYELVAMFMVVYVVSIVLADLLFHHVIALPFTRLELVALP